MLRCFPLRICITVLEMTDYSNQDKGSQCLGTHTFKYAFMPYTGTVESAGIWQAPSASTTASASHRSAHLRTASYR